MLEYICRPIGEVRKISNRQYLGTHGSHHFVGIVKQVKTPALVRKSSKNRGLSGDNTLCQYVDAPS
jgi:hypothetical protein